MADVTSDAVDLPLAGIRIVDAVSGALGAVGRFLGELGAEVIRVEPRDGGPDRRRGTMLAGASLDFVAANLGKQAIGLDLPTDHARLCTLVAEADVLIEATPPGSAEQAALDLPTLRAANPALVVASISDFGQVGPWTHWQASDAVLHALTGGLSRSGLPGRPPLIPPGALAIQTAAAQIAFVILAGLVRRLRTGEGERIDVSLLDAAMQALDPGYGLSGSAQSGVPLWKMDRGRTDERYRYPIIPCADGFVRLCVLAPRQWRGMHAWMGAPEAFAGPEWEKLMVRFRSTTLIPAIAAFFADKTRAEIEREAVAHGVPAAALLDVGEAVATEQMAARSALAPVTVAPGVAAPFPNGAIEIDGRRAGIRGPAPEPGTAAGFTGQRPAFSPPPPADLPLAGIRVLDMGVIVVGGETGRLLADLGADVVKVENGAFPDGQRQSRDDAPVSLTFAAGHRNKRGLSIDLRSPRGRALFLDLAATADVIASNFKPGTLASLGLDAETLAVRNPRLVMVDSSAYGPTGPWSRRLGYGPLVRCSAGLTKQWVYQGEPDSFSDGVTVYPDHVAARVGACGVLALLIRRMRTGRGGTASVSQAEVMLAHKGVEIAALGAAASGHAPLTDDTREDWLLACAGDDEWCVVTLRDDADRAALARIVEGEGRSAADRWASSRDADAVMATLQEAGVAAGRMVRVVEMPALPGYAARGTFRTATHPLFDDSFQVEGPLARFERMPPPDQRPAPRIGEDSAGLLADWLGMDEHAIAPLIADGVIEQAA